MHDAAFVYVSRTINRYHLDDGDILDIGGRDVNGTTRCLFPNAASYTVVDITEHPSVDIVADAGDLNLPDRYDVVISTECLEHTERAADIVAAAFRHLRVCGWFVATMAGPGRPPHGAYGEMLPQPGEFYRNVEPEDLELWLKDAGFYWWDISQFGDDLRCIADRGES